MIEIKRTQTVNYLVIEPVCFIHTVETVGEAREAIKAFAEEWRSAGYRISHKKSKSIVYFDDGRIEYTAVFN